MMDMLAPDHHTTDLLSLAALFLSTLLLLCGDVEVNPGPNTRDSDRTPQPTSATKNWHYAETIKRCQSTIVKEFAVRSQVHDLADDLHRGDSQEYLSYSDQQRVKETQITEDKLNILLTRFLIHNQHDMRKPFEYLVQKISDSQRYSLAAFVLATFKKVADMVEPPSESVFELAQRMRDQYMEVRPSEMQHAWSVVMEYLRPGGSGTGSSAHDSHGVDRSLGAVATTASGNVVMPTVESSVVPNVNTELLEASRTGDIEHITNLLTKPAVDVNVRDAEGRTPLMLALLSGDVRVIGALLDHDQIDLTVTDTNGFSWLMYIYGEEFVKHIYFLTILMENINKAKEDNYMYEIDIATSMENIAQLRNNLDWDQIGQVVKCLLVKNVERVDVVKACLIAGNDHILKIILEHKCVMPNDTQHKQVKKLLNREPNQQSMSYMRGVSVVLRLSYCVPIWDNTDIEEYGYSVSTTINPGITKALIEHHVIKINELSSTQIDAIAESVVRHNDPDLCDFILGIVKRCHVNRTLKTLMRLQSMKPNLLGDLLELGMNDLDLSERDEVGNTVVMLLFRYAGYDAVSQLLSHGNMIDFSIRNSNGQSCLMVSFINKDKRVPTLLLTHPQSFDVVLSDNKNYSTLMYAVRRGCVDDVRSILINSDVDINVVNHIGQTALIEAASRGMPFVHLFHPSDDIEGSDRHELKLTPLINNIKASNCDMVLAILESEKYVDVNITDKDGWTALTLSCRYGSDEMVTSLLTVNGIDVNIGNTNGWTALILACRYGTDDMVTSLLGVVGINVNAVNTDRWTALMLASRYGNEGMVSRLLDVVDIDINAVNVNGWTALMIACRYGTDSLVVHLLDVPNIAVNAKNKDGWTALMIACRYSTDSMVNHLLDVPDILVNGATADGWTHLMVACRDGSAIMVERLLQIDGIDINAARPNGATALMHGCIAGNIEVASLLLQYNVDTTPISCEGKSAVDYANEYHHTDIAELILSRQNQNTHPSQITTD